jgi:hypothetical protein
LTNDIVLNLLLTSGSACLSAAAGFCLFKTNTVAPGASEPCGLRSRIVNAEQSAQNADIPRSCAPPERHAKISLRFPGGILGKALK